MEAEEEPTESRDGRVVLTEGQRFCITGLSLEDAASAAGQPVVSVWAEVGDEALTVGRLSSDQPTVSVEPPMVVGSDVLLRHDCAWSTVLLYGYNLDEDGEAGDQVSGEEAAAAGVGVEYELLSDEDYAARYDSDDGEFGDGEFGDGEEEEEAHDHPPRKASDGDADAESSSMSKQNSSVASVKAPAGIAVLSDGNFRRPMWFAAVKNTAGIMRIAAADDEKTAGSQEEASQEREIVVLYRYTRFSWSGWRGVEACRRTKHHWLRFAVPHAGDMESSLAWAGAALGPLIYPALFRRELWSSLTALAAAKNAVPRRASRLHVVVDVGILRREDHSAQRMGHMRAALEDAIIVAWPERYHVGLELHLPEPVQREVVEDGHGGRDEDGGPRRPAKRRRVAVAEGEECSLCFDPLESGLAAWPGCSHVFHGECVKETLAGRATCPLCRRDLSDALLC